MRQETSEPKFGAKLVSEIRFNTSTIFDSPLSIPGTINVTFFERQRAEVFVHRASFDRQQQLHGLVEFQVVSKVNMDHQGPML
jgi:hypothetical protein